VSRLPIPGFSEALKSLLLEAHGPGLCTFAICRFCGSIEWQSTDQAKPTEAVLVWAHEVAVWCKRCAEFERRFPDVAAWMKRVLLFQEEIVMGSTAAEKDPA
jgi:hypothetical protein